MTVVSVFAVLMVARQGPDPAAGQSALPEGTAKVVFAVHCYDVGKDALRGVSGVLRVERGFRAFREINTVYYDPRLVSVEQMEQALKKAGTYTETVPE
jgi:copper chaperone CopZ